jgi:eukaryotic-like serine/threonine-protein kinase
MPLSTGTKLGPYEILAPLGAGGMGEVYRARDTRLGRDVAIKLLPSHLSSNSELKARFEREARTISSLNHPHICHLYDIGSQDGTDFLVMEYLEGEGLDHRLLKGALPLKQTLEYGVQICEALEKAHRAGIVHRDLKPGNIVLTASGAKLLDFGLAKPAAAVLGAGNAPGAPPLTPSTPTMSIPALTAAPGPLTQRGMIVGTFQYMAPEVLRGQEADARSDLFSLGSVLYEMVTGRRAFEGKSQLSVLSAILEKDPEPVRALQPNAPAALDYTVRTCLEKNPEERFQTAHDVKLQLNWIAQSGSQADVSVPAVNERKKTKAIFTSVAGILAVLVFALVAGRWWGAQPLRRLTRSTLLPPQGMHFAALYRNGPPAISPDGTRMVFVASRDGKTSLWLRPLNKLDANELPETEGGYYPFWSSDGRSIAFFANGKLWRMDASGGSPVAICNAPDARGGSWGANGDIVFDGDSNGMWRVPAAGGTPTAVTMPLRDFVTSDRWPWILPDGQHFVYMHSPLGAGDDSNEIRFASLDGKTNKLLLKGRYYIPEYASGWLLVGRSGTLVAQKFDPTSGELSGDPVQIADNLQVDDNVGSSVFSVSQNGDLIYQQGSSKGGMRYVWTDSSGKEQAPFSELGVYGATRISPDGTSIACLIYEQAGEPNIWVLGLAGGSRFRVSSGGIADMPVWSRDGRTIYYAYSERSGHFQIYQRPTDGSRAPRLLFATPTASQPEDVSTDGKWLLYQQSIRDAPQFGVLKAFPLAGGDQPVSILDRVDFTSNSVLRLGGSDWVAYQSSDSGRAEVYVTRFPNTGARYQVSLAGGIQPVWAKDGKQLYFLDAGQRLSVAEVRTDKDAVQVGPPRTLFQTNVMASLSGAGYDLARDGRFLMLYWAFDTAAPMTMVANWDAELKK